MKLPKTDDAYDRLKMRYERLLEITRELNATQDIPALLVYILQCATELTYTEKASIILVDPESGELRFEAALDEKGRVDEAISSVVVPLEGSIAGWVVTHDEHVLVEDAHNDPRWFRGVDQRTDTETRGLLSVPLTTRDTVIGTVQVLNKRENRPWSDEDVETLNSFAEQAAIAIQTARYFEAEVRRERLERELNIARRIQFSLLPDGTPDIAGYEIAAAYRPANMVGGDFYDFFKLSGGRWGMVVADVADKGVGAALFMAMSRTVIRAAAPLSKGPANTLLRANQIILEGSAAPSIFVTVFYAELDPASGRLVYANGGHNHPIVHRAAKGDSIEITTRGAILGLFDSIPCEEAELVMKSGDRAVFYTDGVNEAMNERGDQFETQRLIDSVDRSAGMSAQETLDAILADVDAFVGETPAHDDLTLFVVRRTG